MKYPEDYKEREGYPYSENPLASLKKPVAKPSGGVSYEAFTVAVPTAVAVGTVNGIKLPSFTEKLEPDNWFFPSDKSYLMMMATDDAEITYHLLGNILEQQGDFIGARKAYTGSIISEKYDNAPSYFRRGKLLLAAGEFEPAIRDLSWAITSTERPVESYLERGIAIFMLGHDKLAQKDFDKYLQLEPAGKDNLASRLDAARKLREELKAQKAPAK